MSLVHPASLALKLAPDAQETERIPETVPSRLSANDAPALRYYVNGQPLCTAGSGPPAGAERGGAGRGRAAGGALADQF